MNLFFEVLGRRDDGFHDVISICTPVSLFDTLTFLPAPTSSLFFSMDYCLATASSVDKKNGLSDNKLPRDERNLVLQAMKLVKERYNVAQGGYIHLLKRIPSEAGLGGGSSDAATAIMMANLGWNLGLTLHEMMKIGAEIGSDVPLFFVRGYSIGTGRGEIVEKIESNVPLDLVIVKPKEGIATKEAFAKLKHIDVQKKKEPAMLLEGLKTGDFRKIVTGMYNRFESVGMELSRHVKQLKHVMAEFGGVWFQMSGSGTACLAVCRNHHHANFVANRFKNLDLGRVYRVKSICQ